MTDERAEDLARAAFGHDGGGLNCAQGVNEYGTPVSIFTCTACGNQFSVCPACTAEERGTTDCLSLDCPSYDPALDIDAGWDDAFATGQIRRRSMNRPTLPEPT